MSKKTQATTAAVPSVLDSKAVMMNNGIAIILSNTKLFVKLTNKHP